jgi:hypothetical protein
MKTTILMFMLIWSCLNLTAQQKISGYSPEIEPYIGFIKEKQTSPATYLLEKFKTHDVIVFGERDHRDITQYYFIEKLIYMASFIQKLVLQIIMTP